MTVSSLCAVFISPQVAVAELVPSVTGPSQPTHADAARFAKYHPDASPPSTNDMSCSVSAERPRPVILVHGTEASAYSDWAGLAPKLAVLGYCVYALNYGGKPNAASYGTEDIRYSAAQLSEFVDLVLDASAARTVDLIGYSQGATMSRFYLKNLDGAAKVSKWIGLATPSYGGDFYGLGPAVRSAPGGGELIASQISRAALQQITGSDFMTALNADGDTVPGVEFTAIGSRYDEVVQPYSSFYLRDRGATNILIQDRCPENMGGHFNMVYDPYAQQLAMNALDPTSAIEPSCHAVQLGTGIAELIAASNAEDWFGASLSVTPTPSTSIGQAR